MSIPKVSFTGHFHSNHLLISTQAIVVACINITALILPCRIINPDILA
jgi:hypothetical protein